MSMFRKTVLNCSCHVVPFKLSISTGIIIQLVATNFKILCFKSECQNCLDANKVKIHDVDEFKFFHYSQNQGDKYLLMTDTPHNLLQKTTPLYTDPVSSLKKAYKIILEYQGTIRKKNIVYISDH